MNRILPKRSWGKVNQIELVESSSRPGVFHHVDVEREFCSCPARVICKHIKQFWCPHCKGMGTLISYPRLIECPVCGGSGLTKATAA